MKNLTLITALTLCSFSWICVSGSESQTVEVQSGDDVTLTCSNMSTYRSMTYWSRLVDRTKASCISVMYSPDGGVTYCDGFKVWEYEMTSNTSTIFLRIRSVKLSDSGLYFCGFLSKDRPTFSVLHLNVEETDLFINETNDYVDNKNEKVSECDGTVKLTSVILGGLTVLLVMVIVGLVVKVRKLQTAASEEQNPHQYENVDPDELRVAALSSYSTMRKRRPASEREEETRVVYAATR